MKMDRAVQPGKGGTLCMTVQDCDEKGRGSFHNQVKGAGSCGKNNYGPAVPSAPALMITLWDAEEGPPQLMAVNIDVAVVRVCTNARKTLGPDGIPNSVWTIVHQANLGIYDSVSNSDLKSKVFTT